MTVIRYIRDVAGRDPERLAIQDERGEVSYGDLWARSGDLARRLQEAGIARGDLVVLCAERSSELIAGALAIMRAGAAYVAVDPAYPDDRVALMVRDCGAAAAVTDAANAPRVTVAAGAAPVVVLDGSCAHEPAFDSAEPDEGDTAYVVYTSGSTGRPKGVLVGHDSLLNLVDWHRAAFSVTAEDRCTQISSPGFDAAMWEIWPALAAGASLHVVPGALRIDPAGLRDWLIERRISVSFLPTALAEAIMALQWPDRAPLRHLLTGGDALTRRPPAAFPATVINNYGLSETTVVATSGEVTPGLSGPPTIGRAISGVTLEVVDAELRPVPDGAEGELVVGGVAVAVGYLGRPELTAERFFERDGSRRYRTGDRVRLNADGEVVFLGRLDDQLSVRGFRIEPGELVAALSEHPAVAAAAVTATGASSAERRLVAHLVATGDRHPADEELAAHVARRLPGYMVPSRFVWLAELPLTAHGKIDRETLARFAVPDEKITSPGDAPAVVAADGDPVETRPTERIIAGILSELLGVAEIEPDQNFFLLGGHSMLGAQLIARLEDRFDVEIGLRFLFDHPTSAAIAGEVDAQRGRDAREDAVV